jgi:hypothetical protein
MGDDQRAVDLVAPIGRWTTGRWPVSRAAWSIACWMAAALAVVGRSNNRDVLPLVLVKAPAEMPVPSEEIGYFRR